jgi:hypothetical protein
VDIDDSLARVDGATTDDGTTFRAQLDDLGTEAQTEPSSKPWKSILGFGAGCRQDHCRLDGLDGTLHGLDVGTGEVTAEVAADRDDGVCTVATKLSAAVGSEDKGSDSAEPKGLGLGKELEGGLLERAAVMLTNNENTV